MNQDFYELLKFGQYYEREAQEKIKEYFFSCEITLEQDEHNYKYIHYDFEILYKGTKITFEVKADKKSLITGNFLLNTQDITN
jgi:hypothetical protein